MSLPHEEEFTQRVEPFRRELLAHCYRLMGSFHDAEDLVQETYLRAWRAYADFQARASMRTWLHRIATNACLNALDRRERRVLPSGLGAAAPEPSGPRPARLESINWLTPLPDGTADHPADPATIVASRETTRLAFIAALQHLPPRQRAVLVLRDVVGWHAGEVAELLDATPAAVNSALQRARAHIERTAPRAEAVNADVSGEARVVEQYVAAFESADVEALARLFRAEVELEMPPSPAWFAGRDNVAAFISRLVIPNGPWRLHPTSANGGPALATYKRSADRTWQAHSIQIVEITDGLIAHLRVFVDPRLVSAFALPMTIS